MMVIYMDIKQRIELLEQDIIELRKRWKNGSPAMKLEVEKKAKNLNAQIHVFESVLRRRGEMPPTEKQVMSIQKAINDKLIEKQPSLL